MFKIVCTIALFLGLASGLAADETTAAKDKGAAVAKDAQDSTGFNAETDAYIKDVQARRAKYGNADGLKHAKMIKGTQLAVTLGELMYSGDAFNAPGLFSTSDFDGLNIGLVLSNALTDNVGWEVWGDWAQGTKNATEAFAPSASSFTVSQFDIGLEPRLQALFSLGDQGYFLVPHVGLGPVVSMVSTSAKIVDASGNQTAAGGGNGTGWGAAITVGADLQMDAAVVGLRYRYMLCSDTGGNFASRNLNAGLPEVSVGWVF